MSKMHPNCVTDAELEQLIPKTQGGWAGERRLYRFFHDWMPDDWDVFYNQRLPHEEKGECQLDFVVLVPNRGAVNVDAKGSGYFLEEGQVWFENQRTGQRQQVNIFDDACSAKLALDQFIRNRISGKKAWGAHEYLVVFTKGSAVVPPGAEATGHAFTIEGYEGHPQQTADAMSARIRSLLDGHPDLEKHFTGDRARQLKGWLGATLIPRRESLRFVGWDRVSEQCLVGKQREVFNRLLKARVGHVKGGAGTGKTLIALALAKRYAQEGKRTLLVCYNRMLEEFLKRKASGDGRSLPNLSITKFYTKNGLFGDGLEFNFPPGPDWRPKSDALIREAVAKGKGAGCFDVLIVDEAQDLNQNELEMLLSVLGKERKVVLFSDSEQTVFSYNGRQKGWDYDETTLFPGERVEHQVLNVNYRNAKPIHERIIPYEVEKTIAYWDEETMGVAPEPVREVEMKQVRKILREILTREDGATFRDIAFLSYDEKAFQEMRDFPDGARGMIKFTDNLVAWENGLGILKAKTKRFKGLEANIVFLFGFDGNQVDDEAKYVGLSRAKYELYIVK